MRLDVVGGKLFYNFIRKTLVKQVNLFFFFLLLMIAFSSGKPHEIVSLLFLMLFLSQLL